MQNIYGREYIRVDRLRTNPVFPRSTVKVENLINNKKLLSALASSIINLNFDLLLRLFHDNFVLAESAVLKKRAEAIFSTIPYDEIFLN